MSVSDSYCILPFIHLAVSNSGNVQACCLSKHSLKKVDDSSFTVNSDAISSVWNSEELEQLRTDLLTGKKPKNCERCWNDERLGVYSKRQRDNETWKRHYGLTQALQAPVTLDLKLGNLCNLKCRICNPHASSKFGKEAFELFGNFDFNKLQESVKWAENPDGEFWRDLKAWLPTVEHFDIYGGEPFLSKPHFAILEESVRLGYSKNQTLHYNTNATVFPERIVKEVWPHFKAVNVMLSIDGIGPQFEYQRFPAEWSVVETNVKKFMAFDYLNLDICYTVNSMNIFSFPDFYKWARNVGLRFWINYLYDPKHFRAQIFSSPAKKIIEAKLRSLPKDMDFSTQIEPLINFMWDTSFSDDDRVFSLQQLKIYDEHRKQSFRNVFPETYELLLLSEPLEQRPDCFA